MTDDHDRFQALGPLVEEASLLAFDRFRKRRGARGQQEGGQPICERRRSRRRGLYLRAYRAALSRRRDCGRCPQGNDLGDRSDRRHVELPERASALGRLDRRHARRQPDVSAWRDCASRPWPICRGRSGSSHAVQGRAGGRPSAIRAAGFETVGYRCASASLYFAVAGALSGYYERGLGLWDIAAGAALCIAAGIDAEIVWEADQAPFILKAVPGL